MHFFSSFTFQHVYYTYVTVLQLFHGFCHFCVLCSSYSLCFLEILKVLLPYPPVQSLFFNHAHFANQPIQDTLHFFKCFKSVAFLFDFSQNCLLFILSIHFFMLSTYLFCYSPNIVIIVSLNFLLLLYLSYLHCF